MGIDVWAKRVGLLRSTSVNSVFVTRVVMAPSGDATTMLRPPSGKSATAVGPGHRYFPAEDQTPGCARSNTAGLCACTTETQATTRLIAINPCMAWLYVCNLTISILNYVARRTKRAVRCSTRGHRGMPRRFRSKYHGVTADGDRKSVV